MPRVAIDIDHYKARKSLKKVGNVLKFCEIGATSACRGRPLLLLTIHEDQLWFTEECCSFFKNAHNRCCKLKEQSCKEKPT